MFRSFFTRAAFLATLATLANASSAASLRLEIVDESGQPLPARVLVRPVGQAAATPEGAVVLPVGEDRWFFSRGDAVLDVPVGNLELRVERGPEYKRIRRQVTVGGSSHTERVTLARWIDMRSRGYKSGENHLHESAARLKHMLIAEDLDFGTSLTWWNGPDAQRLTEPGNQAIRRLGSASNPLPTSLYDAEVEYDWGAVYFTGASAPLRLASDPRRPNLDYIREARDSGAIVHYQAGWSREVLVDALLGTVDVVNVANNLFHMHRFMPRGRYSNLLEVEDFPRYEDTPEGMYRMNTDTYYRLLNLGLRLAAGAGSATGAKENPPGFNRAYVRVDKDASIAGFYREWAKGRNFVTNGPMIELRTADGARPGDTIDLRDAGRLSVHVTAHADMPLETLELVVNGEVRESFGVAGKRDFEAAVELDLAKGAWLALRATARDELLSAAELAAYSAGAETEPLRVRPSNFRFAHTSPIYITVGGRGAAVAKSFAEAHRMLDAFESFAMRAVSDEFRSNIDPMLRRARAELEARATSSVGEGMRE